MSPKRIPPTTLNLPSRPHGETSPDTETTRLWDAIVHFYDPASQHKGSGGSDDAHAVNPLNRGLEQPAFSACSLDTLKKPLSLQTAPETTTGSHSLTPTAQGGLRIKRAEGSGLSNVTPFVARKRRSSEEEED